MLRQLAHRASAIVTSPTHTHWCPTHFLHAPPPLCQMDLHSVVSRLDQLAPTDRAEDWDNVGLLVEPSTSMAVERIFLTNDLTEEVLDEAVGLAGRKVGLIVAYHPPIFTPLTRLTQRSAKERIIQRCVASQIAIYSPHTALDGLINKWLVRGLGAGEVAAITNTKDATESKGCLTTLSSPVALSSIVSRVKQLLKLSHVRLAVGGGASGDPMVSTIAAAAGSGASVLKGVCADVYLTGEMSHHGVLEATAQGASVILTEHSNSERPFLCDAYRQLLEGPQGLDGAVEITMSSLDRDPLLVA